MERLYYVECEHETAETSDRFEASKIAAEWIKRGYEVETVAVDVTAEAVRMADSEEEEFIAALSRSLPPWPAPPVAARALLPRAPPRADAGTG